jgi:putative (di)nucleoside polyphosphate hydrolase|tara:strand:- start:1197 stop:1682 length:486 start_codon:yes stop_codon:yes gene_type:complete
MDKKLENFQKLPYRNGVGIVVLNNENKVFVAKRIDNPKNFWQMPQGGVDEGEDLLNAAYRELKEETSIFNVKLIKEIEDWTQYDLPSKLIGIIWKGRYKGQKQKWFIFKFLGNDTEINIKTKNPEFLDWKWIEIGKITEIVVDFKKEVYQKVEKEIKKIIN